MSTILLQAQQAQGTDYSFLIMMGALVIIFYFFMIRPQQKKQKDQKKFIDEIKKGDDIVTIGGIHGKIAALDDNTVTIDIEKGARIKFERSAISLDATRKLSENKS